MIKLANLGEAVNTVPGKWQALSKCQVGDGSDDNEGGGGGEPSSSPRLTVTNNTDEAATSGWGHLLKTAAVVLRGRGSNVTLWLLDTRTKQLTPPPPTLSSK